ncbi:polyamine ABC transporter substrate-binding protein [Aestuariirhabdus sp. Z084]|uniref:polyamine ABC transporter substrate-binding protein n=1 Tax=Aestuariirhabdus haliotis TaxID=2918751 RepID=UPI00201B3A73|nr:polyamine ABC transporter substrate-binding protein [Aestuariirhabdus haliotis]MCL6416563.1 polyamine ABC transporter substrate-binding protein [Aestuariirhabdus haliotis]MCL6420570.1 polyamine ABC transporter substrate-binding protein [Aestuariirhabdus haliotis]
MPVLNRLCAPLLIALFSASQVWAEGQVNVYNWNDYIAEDTIANFQKETGIKVVYDVFDANEVLEAKLLTGQSGYDLVVPSDNFMAKQITAGIYQPLDKSKLPNLKHLNPKLMSELAEITDPGNKYGVPYMWGTTGIGYNPEKVKAVLGEDAPVDSWALIFEPRYMEKLATCGVSFMDSPDEMMPLALNYLGLDPNSLSAADYDKAAELMQQVRPYISYFHSSKYIADLANGDTCVAVGWSGDVLQAADRADEAGNGVMVAYSIPKEGAPIWFDMIGIPKDAPNVENAHLLINYLLEPAVMAEIVDYVAYATPNDAAIALVDEDIRNDQGIFPGPEVMAKLYLHKPLLRKLERKQTRLWTRLKSGQ